MPPIALPFAKWRSANQRSIVLIGLSGSGTTTFCQNLVDKKDKRPPPPTVAYNTASLTLANEKYTVVDVGGHGLGHRGSQAKAQFLNRHSIVFYVHDCSNSDKLDESVWVLHAHLDDFVRAGVRHLWVILNRQDLEKNHTQAAKERFELDLKCYGDQILWRVVDLPGTSGLTGCRLDEIKQQIPSAFLSKFEPKAPAPKSSPATVVIELERWKDSFPFAPDDDQYGKLSSDEFWACVVKEKPALIRHGTRVRAAYFAMLESLQSNRSVKQTANDSRLLEWLQFDPKHSGNRYVVL
jgi:hypothetical protein